MPLENNTDKPPSTGPCLPWLCLPTADPTTFAEGPDTTPAGTTPAGTAPAGTAPAPNNAFGVGTTATGTDTGRCPACAVREPVTAAAVRGPRTTPSARTTAAGPVTAPAEPRPGVPPPRRAATAPSAESADVDADESARPPSA